MSFSVLQTSWDMPGEASMTTEAVPEIPQFADEPIQTQQSSHQHYAPPQPQPPAPSLPQRPPQPAPWSPQQPPSLPQQPPSLPQQPPSLPRQPSESEDEDAPPPLPSMPPPAPNWNTFPDQAPVNSELSFFDSSDLLPDTDTDEVIMRKDRSRSGSIDDLDEVTQKKLETVRRKSAFLGINVYDTEEYKKIKEGEITAVLCYLLYVKCVWFSVTLRFLVLA